jgi:hypothetical protein
VEELRGQVGSWEISIGTIPGLEKTLSDMWNAITALQNETGVTTVPVTGVSLTEESLTIKAAASGSKQYQLSWAVSPDDATNKYVLFSSSDPDVADVNPLGTLFIKEPGEAVITAHTLDGNFTAACVVEVTPAALWALSITRADGGVELESRLNEQVSFELKVTPSPGRARFDPASLYWQFGSQTSPPSVVSSEAWSSEGYMGYVGYTVVINTGDWGRTGTLWAYVPNGNMLASGYIAYRFGDDV